MSTSPSQLASLAAIFLLAGLVKGVTGLGLPTVGVGLMSLILPSTEAAALIVVPSLVTNLWQMISGTHLAAIGRRLWPMMAGICLGCWLGRGTMAGAAGTSTLAALGIALIVYAILGLSTFRLPTVRPGAEPWLGPIAGVLTGIVTAATGVFVLPAVPYLQSLGLDRDALVQAMGTSFTVSTAALALLLASSGTVGGETLLESSLALVPAGLGMLAGQFLFRSLRPEIFRRCFFAGLLLLGAHLFWQGFY